MDAMVISRSSDPGIEEGPSTIRVRGAAVRNLRNVDLDVPLRRLVAIAGVSGSGKSSLAMGVLYAEGSRRYIEALSTYTRRRMSHMPRAQVTSVEHVPAALALRQRPAVPGVRSTFGTSTELLNVLRLMFSRLGSHRCPNGHQQVPTIDVAAGLDLRCPVCSVVFAPPGAEALSFNAGGACPTCRGTAIVREIDDRLLIPDERKTIDDGAVAPWSMLGLTFMPRVVAELGVRIDVPIADLTAAERSIVMDGPAEKKRIAMPSKSGKVFELDFTYRNARLVVREAMDKATTDKGLRRIGKFISSAPCSNCHGTRLDPKILGTLIGSDTLADVTAKTLDELVEWAAGVRDGLPPEMVRMADDLTDTLLGMTRRLTQLGLGYLALDRAGSTLSTGERQRVHLTRAVRNRTTGVLYVLDEPSIGLHPMNVDGLLGVMRDLLRDGNSVVFVDHDVQVLREADWLIEIGPGAGRDGGRVIAEGTVQQLGATDESLLGGFLTGRDRIVANSNRLPDNAFEDGCIELEVDAFRTVQPATMVVPFGRLTMITGPSGSGKTTLVLDSLIPALQAREAGGPAPAHVVRLDGPRVARVNMVDATPIGANVRSTVATYSGVMDLLRRAFASTDAAAARQLTAADFSYNTGSLRCPQCEGSGVVVLDVQFLPDVEIDCPACLGSRFSNDANDIRHASPLLPDGIALPELLRMTVVDALEHAADIKGVRAKLDALIELGLGYLTLGEATPALSGGEAQRLKLAGELHRDQSGTVFVLDEPSVGLHPLDIRTLLGVLDRLVNGGATVIVIEHDLDMIANADHIIDMGPGGGSAGGRIVATGGPDHIARDEVGVTGRYLAHHRALSAR